MGIQPGAGGLQLGRHHLIIAPFVNTLVAPLGQAATIGSLDARVVRRGRDLTVTKAPKDFLHVLPNRGAGTVGLALTLQPFPAPQALEEGVRKELGRGWFLPDELGAPSIDGALPQNEVDVEVVDVDAKTHLE